MNTRRPACGLAVDREVDEAGAEVEHPRGVERPLVALAEDVGGELLRRAVVVGEEVVLLPVRIDGVDVRQRLDVGAGEVPGEALAPRADAELALGQVDELDAGIERQAERAEAAVGIDAVAVELAGSAGGEDEHRALEEDEAEGVVATGLLRAGPSGRRRPAATRPRLRSGS